MTQDDPGKGAETRRELSVCPGKDILYRIKMKCFTFLTESCSVIPYKSILISYNANSSKPLSLIIINNYVIVFRTQRHAQRPDDLKQMFQQRANPSHRHC